MLVDFQNVVVTLPVVPHTATEVVGRAVELAAAFRTHGLPVVLVRVSLQLDGSDGAQGRTEFPRPDIEMPADWDEIIDELSGHPEDIVIVKRGWGAFYGTSLDMELRRRGITHLVLAGLTTGIGVDTTAREAHHHNYHVTLATDAMADMSIEAHDNSVERIFPQLGERGTTADIIALLDKTRA
ncbi:isochorismatase family protein [Nocardia sp. NPDC004604]|uniref:isochorismatase family protein n=1 Tax=Nocardia sp. NPDC004604 TaxID=3157013 RepID=UPI0033B838D9